MKAATLSRRLLAGAAGLAIGLGGILAVSAPAQATGEGDEKSHHPVVISHPDCDDPMGYIEIPHFWGILIRYQLDGAPVSPGEQALGPGDYTVTKEIKVRGNWQVKKTWDISFDEPDCEEEEEEEEKERKKLVKKPEVTPPTCEELGSITIPAAGHIELFVYSVNGEPVERGSTIDIGFGSYTVQVHGKFTQKLWKEFHYDFDEDCPEDEEPDNGKDEEEEENGEGGELPVTGAQTALVAGGALLLLTLGGAMYVMARRRRITFTA